MCVAFLKFDEFLQKMASRHCDGPGLKSSTEVDGHFLVVITHSQVESTSKFPRSESPGTRAI
jgi:hypothetical protein